jgi:hypothetical protein
MLEASVKEAAQSVSDAQARFLTASLRHLPIEEFVRLRQEAAAARCAMNEARTILHAHLIEHGC